MKTAQKPVYVLEERLRKHRDLMKQGLGFEYWGVDEGTASLMDENGHIVLRIVNRNGRMHVVSEVSGSEVTVMMPMLGIAHQVYEMVVAHEIARTT